jgi:hypothetical protein
VKPYRLLGLHNFVMTPTRKIGTRGKRFGDCAEQRTKEGSMPLIQVSVVKGVFSSEQKTQMICGASPG